MLNIAKKYATAHPPVHFVFLRSLYLVPDVTLSPSLLLALTLAPLLQNFAL